LAGSAFAIEGTSSNTAPARDGWADERGQRSDNIGRDRLFINRKFLKLLARAEPTD